MIDVEEGGGMAMRNPVGRSWKKWLSIALVLFYLASFAVIFIHPDHECQGEGCLCCLGLRRFLANTQHLHALPALGSSAVILLLASSSAGASRFRCRCLSPSLVDLHIRLDH